MFTVILVSLYLLSEEWQHVSVSGVEVLSRDLSSKSSKTVFVCLFTPQSGEDKWWTSDYDCYLYAQLHMTASLSGGSKQWSIQCKVKNTKALLDSLLSSFEIFVLAVQSRCQFSLRQGF